MWSLAERDRTKIPREAFMNQTIILIVKIVI